MKRAFSALGAVAWIFCFASLVACSAGPEGSETSGNLSVKAVIPDENGRYSFQVFELLGIKNLENLNGFYANFLLAPKRKAGKIEGLAPKLHFIKSSQGYLVPSDSFSSELVSLYRSFQTIYDFDRSLGVEKLNSWPRKVAVGVTAAGDTPTNNAFYDSLLDAFIFLRYTDKHLPIPVNFGIIAHEHFHSLFHKLVLKDTPLAKLSVSEAEAQYKKLGFEKLREKPETESSSKEISGEASASSSLGSLKVFETKEAKDTKMMSMELRRVLSYNLTLIKGMNEGLADTWAYLVLGDPDFLQKSIPAFAEARSLKAHAEDTFVNKAMILQLIQRQQSMALNSEFSEKSLMGYAYAIGTQYSRMLRSFTLAKAQARGISEAEARLVMAKSILNALKKMKATVTDLAYKTEIDPSVFIVTLAEQFEQLSEAECDTLRMAFHDQFTTEKCEPTKVVAP